MESFNVKLIIFHIGNMSTKNLPKGINWRIAQIIKELGLTQDKFAKTVGVSTGYISKVVNGNSKPSIEILMGISNSYRNIDERWLLTGEGEMYRQPVQQEKNQQGVAEQAGEYSAKKTLSKQEEAFVDMLRLLPDEEKKRIKGVMEERQQFAEMMEKIRRLEEEKGKSA